MNVWMNKWKVVVQAYLLSIKIFDFILLEARKVFPSTVFDRSGMILQNTHTHTDAHTKTDSVAIEIGKGKSGRKGIRCMDKWGSCMNMGKWVSEWVSDQEDIEDACSPQLNTFCNAHFNKWNMILLRLQILTEKFMTHLSYFKTTRVNSHTYLNRSSSKFVYDWVFHLYRIERRSCTPRRGVSVRVPVIRISSRHTSHSW